MDLAQKQGYTVPSSYLSLNMKMLLICRVPSFEKTSPLSPAEQQFYIHSSLWATDLFLFHVCIVLPVLCLVCLCDTFITLKKYHWLVSWNQTSGFILLMMFLLNQKDKIGCPKIHKLMQKPSNSESLEATAEKSLNNISLKLSLSFYGNPPK